MRTALLITVMVLAAARLATYPYQPASYEQRNIFYYSSGGIGLLAIVTVFMIVLGVL